MSRFGEDLRQVAAGLDLPQPVRSRFLLELAADLEDLHTTLLAEGLGEEEARRRALNMLLPAPDALAELRGLHRPLYQRLVDRFSDRARHRLERVLLGGVSLVLLASATQALLRLDPPKEPSVFVWPLLVLAVLVLGAGLGKLFQLYVAKDHAPARLRRGMSLLPTLAGTSAAVGLAGAVLDFYGTAAAIEADIALQGALVLGWVRRDAAMLALALLVAVAAALLWFVAAVRIARIEQSEMEALGLLPDRTPGPVT